MKSDLPHTYRRIQKLGGNRHPTDMYHRRDTSRESCKSEKCVVQEIIWWYWKHTHVLTPIASVQIWLSSQHAPATHVWPAPHYKSGCMIRNTAWHSPYISGVTYTCGSAQRRDTDLRTIATGTREACLTCGTLWSMLINRYPKFAYSRGLTQVEVPFPGQVWAAVQQVPRMHVSPTGHFRPDCLN